MLPYFNYKAGLRLPDEAESKEFFAYLDKLCAPIADEKELQKIFNAWCSKSGYFSYIFERKRPQDMNNRDEVVTTLPIRNIFTCQTHHDLLRTDLLLVERYQFLKAQEDFHLVSDAQHPSFVKL